MMTAEIKTYLLWFRWIPSSPLGSLIGNVSECDNDGYDIMGDDGMRGGAVRSCARCGGDSIGLRPGAILTRSVDGEGE